MGESAPSMPEMTYRSSSYRICRRRLELGSCNHQKVAWQNSKLGKLTFESMCWTWILYLFWFCEPPKLSWTDEIHDHPFFEGQDLLKLSVWLRTVTKRQFLFRKKPSQIFGENTSECYPLFLEGLRFLVKSSPHHPLSTFFTTCPKQTIPKNLNNRISAFLSILGGAFKYFWNFHPDPCGNDPIWWTYYSNGLVQPATSIWVEKISKSTTTLPKTTLK